MTWVRVATVGDLAHGAVMPIDLAGTPAILYREHNVYYAAQRALPRPATTDPAKVAEGKRLATFHHCASCHRPDLSGQQQVPRLAGQDYEYLLRLLRGFKARTASDLDGTMTMAAQPLREEDIENLVHYLASLGASP